MTAATPKTIRLLGGCLSLDFVNSMDWDEHGEPRAGTDALADPASLIMWGRRLGVVSPGARPAVDEEELASSLNLRLALHDLMRAIATGGSPARRDLAFLAAQHAEAVGAAELTWEGDRCRLHWRRDDPRRVRFAVAVDAVTLLKDADRLERVRVCPGHRCGWLFIDASGRRRWCSMQTCGSRAKMRRLYERQRSRG